MLDAFEALGVEPRFDLDLAGLEQRHRELSRALHPDRHASAGASERRLALGRAIEVNEAFRALKDPVRRAEALLARHGVASGEGAEPPAPPSLLMEVMERREALAEIRHTQDRAALSNLLEAVREREARAQARIGHEFAAQSPNYGEILQTLAELRYHRRFASEAESIADDLL